MSLNTHFSAAFRRTIINKLGMHKSGLLQSVTVLPWEGGYKTEYSDGFDSIDREAIEVTERYGDTPHREANAYRRAITMKSWDDGVMIDPVDQGKFTPHDPEDAFVKMIHASIVKKFDRYVLEQMFATAYGGEDGTTPYAFDGAQTVAVNSWLFGSGSGDASMTVSKFIEAKARLIDANDQDDDTMAGDPISAAMTTDEIGSMLTFEELTNSDYVGELRALRDGKVNEFLGVNVVRVSKKRVPLLSTDATIRRIPFYFKSAIEVRQKEMGERDAWVKERTDKKGIDQVYARKWAGASRIDEKKIVDVRSKVIIA